MKHGGGGDLNGIAHVFLFLLKSRRKSRSAIELVLFQVFWMYFSSEQGFKRLGSAKERVGQNSFKVVVIHLTHKNSRVFLLMKKARRELSLLKQDL